MTAIHIGEAGERLRRSTVQIGMGRATSGSGVIWHSGGTVVTNSHVVPEGVREEPVVTLYDGRTVRGRVLVRDRRRDLLALEVALPGLQAVERRGTQSLRPGELVLAVGNPLGFIGALTRGTLFSVGPLPSIGKLPWVQADVRLAPGNSGGPLGDAGGRVIGVNSMIAGSLALAVPADLVQRFLQTGASAGWVGLTVRPVQGGLLILEIAKDGPAEQASLLPGDLLLAANGTKLQKADDLLEALEQSGTLRVRFRRGGPKGVGREVVVVPSRMNANAA